MLLRAVIDTNVCYSGLINKFGTTATILDAGAKNKFQALTSTAIIDELASALRSKAKWSEERILQSLKTITHHSEIILLHDIEIENQVCDVDDDHIVACAVAGKADLIVTGDKDLYAYKSFLGVGVVRPVDFIRTLNL